METLQASTIANSSEGLWAVASDSSKVYFCSHSMIYRANFDGSKQETVLSANDGDACKFLQTSIKPRASKYDSHNLVLLSHDFRPRFQQSGFRLDHRKHLRR